MLTKLIHYSQSVDFSPQSKRRSHTNIALSSHEGHIIQYNQGDDDF